MISLSNITPLVWLRFSRWLATNHKRPASTLLLFQPPNQCTGIILTHAVVLASLPQCFWWEANTKSVSVDTKCQYRPIQSHRDCGRGGPRQYHSRATFCATRLLFGAYHLHPDSTNECDTLPDRVGGAITRRIEVELRPRGREASILIQIEINPFPVRSKDKPFDSKNPHKPKA